MPRATRSAKKIQSFAFDFSKDSGAIGVYKAGITIPKNAFCYNWQLWCTSAVNGFGSITVGVVGQPLYYITGPAAFPFPVGNVNDNVLDVIGLGLPLIMSIVGGPITSGKFIYSILYYESVF